LGPRLSGFCRRLGVAVAVAITGLWRAPLCSAAGLARQGSKESGVIAGLIFFLMLTYLAGLALPEGNART